MHCEGGKDSGRRKPSSGSRQMMRKKTGPGGRGLQEGSSPTSKTGSQPTQMCSNFATSCFRSICLSDYGQDPFGITDARAGNDS